VLKSVSWILQCDGCECWLQQQYIGMSTTQYINFSQLYLVLLCRQCTGSGDDFSFHSSLSHISVLSPDMTTMRSRAASQLNLLQFYSITLPQVVSVTCSNVTVLHRQSELPLCDHSPWLLDQYVLADVQRTAASFFELYSFLFIN